MLLGPGRHYMNFDEVLRTCVEPFKCSRREVLASSLHELIEDLGNHKIMCELWIDGSFVTQKQEPNDVDLSIMIPAEDFDSLSLTAQQYLEELEFQCANFPGDLDAFVGVMYERGTPEWEEDRPEEWAYQWSREHNTPYLKGFIVVRVE